MIACKHSTSDKLQVFIIVLKVITNDIRHFTDTCHMSIRFDKCQIQDTSFKRRVQA